MLFASKQKQAGLASKLIVGRRWSHLLWQLCRSESGWYVCECIHLLFFFKKKSSLYIKKGRGNQTIYSYSFSEGYYICFCGTGEMDRWVFSQVREKKRSSVYIIMPLHYHSSQDKGRINTKEDNKSTNLLNNLRNFMIWVD